MDYDLFPTTKIQKANSFEVLSLLKIIILKNTFIHL